MPDFDQLWKDAGPEALQMWGKGNEGLFRVASGMYGEEAKKALAPVLPAINSTLPTNTTLGPIKDQWVNPEDTASGDFKEEAVELGDLKKPEDKLKLLNHLTQNIAGDSESTGMCAATSLMAAAIQGGGIDGIKELLAMARKGLTPGDDLGKGNLAAVERAIKSGHATTEDLNLLESELNLQLREKQNKEFPNADIPRAGVDPKILKEFIGGSKTMSGYFKEGGMSIESVDADEQAGADHYVLNIGGENGFVYDPMARKDKNQLVFNPLEIKKYHQQEDKDDSINGNLFKGMY